MQQVIVENRPGLPGTASVATAAKDGYTLMLTSNGHTIARAINKSVPFDPVKDFAGISVVANAPVAALVPADSPAKTLKEFIELAQKNPGKFNFGSAGVASTTFLATEVMRQEAKINMVHVPFKGAPEAVTAVLRGDVQLYFAPIPAAMSLGGAGKVRVLAVNSAKRVPQLPDVPTVAEAALPGYEASVWYGVVAPARTPREVVQRLNTEIARIVADPAHRERMSAGDFEPTSGTPDEFAAFIRSETAKWGKVVKASGAKGE